MEHKIGEVFTFNGIKLEVSNSVDVCEGCYFFEEGVVCSLEVINAIGSCWSERRNDRKDIIFKKVE